MNIKQVEQLTGVSRQNIRFYEKEGLIAPARNAGNAYRAYSDGDVRAIKLIRALRMLDMPLDEIRQVFAGELPLSRAAAVQAERLRSQAEKLEAAIETCGTLRAEKAETLDVDALLDLMQAKSEKGGYFMQWMEDYQRVAAAQGKRQFSFMPDDAVTNPYEFENALYAFANAHGQTLVMVKRGMYPVFTLDGVEYTASRSYSRYMARIDCRMTHPEAAPEDARVAPGRRKILRILWNIAPFLAVLVIEILTTGFDLSLWFSPDGLALVAVAFVLWLPGFFYFRFRD